MGLYIVLDATEKGKRKVFPLEVAVAVGYPWLECALLL